MISDLGLLTAATVPHDYKNCYRSSFPSFFSLPKDISPISLFTIIFTLTYLAYDRFLWKLNPFDKIPDLSGTWLGVANNPYFRPLRVELMQVKQQWSRICITVEVYEQQESEPRNWRQRVRLGTEHSTNAHITECEVQHCNFGFQYSHDGEAEKQESFCGTFFLKYKCKNLLKHKSKIYELQGKYSNTKKYLNTGKNFEGVVGRVVFRRVNHKIIEHEEAIDEHEKVLNELKKELIKLISEVSED